MNFSYLVLHWFIKREDESVFNCIKLTLTEDSEAVGKIVLGCAVCRTKRYQFASRFVAPLAVCFVGSEAFSCFIQRMKLAVLYWICLGLLLSQLDSPRKYNCMKGKKEYT